MIKGDDQEDFMSFLYSSICSWGSIILIIVLIVLGIRKKFERTRVVIMTTLFLYGLIGAITYPSYFAFRVSKVQITDKEFIHWASTKVYGSVSILAITTITVFIVAFVILVFFNKYASWLKTLMVFSQIFLIVLGVFISFDTINKIFDIARYISGAAYYHALILLAIPISEMMSRKKCEM